MLAKIPPTLAAPNHNHIRSMNLEPSCNRNVVEQIKMLPTNCELLRVAGSIESAADCATSHATMTSNEEAVIGEINFCLLMAGITLGCAYNVETLTAQVGLFSGVLTILINHLVN